MSQKEYIYDAFISYRHTELDKFVAETLHKQMEAFKPPKQVTQKVDAPRKKIERVFRDRDELPLASNLEDPIVEALKNSEYLVVVCSPRLKESMWCKKEIQTFIELHGRRKILAVLIEGEPEESFPEELLYEEVVVDSDAVMPQTMKKPIEPLAADFRGKTKAEMKKAMKTEMLRLLAPMFGVSYDDLRQRHREQRIRKIMTCSLIGAAAGIAIGTYSTCMAIKIANQAKELAYQQGIYLSKEAMELYEKSDRKGAVTLAFEALTKYRGVTMPDNAEAQKTLTEVLGLYDGSFYGKGIHQIEVEGILSEMQVSPNEENVLVADNLGNLYMIDVNARKVAFQVTESDTITSYGFIDDDNFFYYSFAAGLKKVIISEQKAYLYEEADIANTIWNVAMTPDGKKLIVQKTGQLEIVDTSSFTKKTGYVSEGLKSLDGIYVSDQSDMAYVVDEEDGKQYLTAIKLDTGKIAFRLQKPSGELGAIVNGEGVTYVLSYEIRNLLSGKSILSAVTNSTGEAKFVREYEDTIATKLAYSKGGQGENLLLYNDKEAIFVESQHGNINETYHIDENIAKCDPSGDGGFNLMTETGVCHVISGAEGFVDLSFNSIVCNNVKQMKHTTGGMAILRENDNRLILCGYVRNADSKVYEEKLAEPVQSSLLSEEAKERAATVLEKASFADSYLEIPDSKLIVVHTMDGILRIYKSGDADPKTTYESGVSALYEYYGFIKGYYVISDGTYGYLIDSEGQIRAKIDDFAGVSLDGTSLVVYGRDENAKSASIAIPVYTKEELLKKTEGYLEGRIPSDEKVDSK